MTTIGEVPPPEPGYIDDFQKLREFIGNLRDWINWVSDNLRPASSAALSSGPAATEAALEAPGYLQGTFNGTLVASNDILTFVAPVNAEIIYVSGAAVGEGGSIQLRINGTSTVLDAVLVIPDNSSAVYDQPDDFDSVILAVGDEIEVRCEATSASSPSIVQVTLGQRPD